MPSICYLTGYETNNHFAPAFLLVDVDGVCGLLVDDFEVHNVAVSSRLTDVTTFPAFGDPVPPLLDLLRERGWAGRRIGWERNWFGTWHAEHLRVADEMVATWRLEAGLVEAVMASKSSEELSRLREAGRITVKGMHAAFATIGDGVTDNQVAASIYHSLMAGGSEHLALSPVVSVGDHTGIPHANHRRRPARSGDPVWMEFGACVARYSAPMMRSPVVGAPPDRRWLLMYEAVRAAVELTIEGMGPGVSGRELARAATRPLDALSADVIRDGNRGYSVGLGFQPVWLDVPGLLVTTTSSSWAHPGVRDDFRLEPGHVFHVRATTRVAGRYGATCSDTVAINETGCEVLTPFTRELAVLH
jgi:Xaa-Pro dipeptidase